jgi:hypothetical protein
MGRQMNHGIVALLFSTALAISATNAFAAEHGGGGGHGGFGGGERGGFGGGEHGGFGGGERGGFGGGEHGGFGGGERGEFGGGEHRGFGGGERGGFGTGEHGGFDRGAHADFHGRDFGRFSGPERHLWEGGSWLHDWHAGVFGWWWLVDGGWYYYPEPIYPYPTYVPAASFGEPALNAPPGVLAGQNWYFCDNPQGYYPNVPNCSVDWRAVPITQSALPPASLPSPALHD